MEALEAPFDMAMSNGLVPGGPFDMVMSNGPPGNIPNQNKTNNCSSKFVQNFTSNIVMLLEFVNSFESASNYFVPKDDD